MTPRHSEMLVLSELNDQNGLQFTPELSPHCGSNVNDTNSVGFTNLRKNQSSFQVQISSQFLGLVARGSSEGFRSNWVLLLYDASNTNVTEFTDQSTCTATLIRYTFHLFARSWYFYLTGERRDQRNGHDHEKIPIRYLILKRLADWKGTHLNLRTTSYRELFSRRSEQQTAVVNSRRHRAGKSNPDHNCWKAEYQVLHYRDVFSLERILRRVAEQA